MFDKRKEAAETESVARSPAAAPPDDTKFKTRSNAMIGPSIVLEGSITGEENLLIEGSVNGSIALPKNDLTIGESGRVKADLNAKVIRVDGLVTGDMKGAEKVVISKTGRVQGNIIAPRVTLEDGAKFKGSIDMDPGENTAAAPAPVKAASKPNETTTAAEKEAG